MCRWTLGNVPNSRQSLKEPLSPQFCGLRWVQAHLWEWGAGCTAVPVPQGILSALSSLPSHTDSALCRVCGTWASHPCCPRVTRDPFAERATKMVLGTKKSRKRNCFYLSATEMCAAVWGQEWDGGVYPNCQHDFQPLSFLQLLKKISVTKDNRKERNYLLFLRILLSNLARASLPEWNPNLLSILIPEALILWWYNK